MQQRTFTVLAVSAVFFVSSLAYAGDLFFRGDLSGAQEEPEIVTANSGVITVRANPELTQVVVRLRVSEVGDVVAAHLHCNRAGENGGLALGLVAPGPCAFDGNHLQCTLTNADILATPGVADCLATIGQPINNIASLVAAIRAGNIYANVHTGTNGGGEVRAQLR